MGDVVAERKHGFVRFRWMPGLAWALACTAAPAGPDVPPPAAAGSVLRLEEGGSPRVLYHEERGGLVNTVPGPKSVGRAPPPPLGPSAKPSAPPVAQPSRAAAVPAVAQPSRPVAASSELSRQWGERVDRAAERSDGAALVALASAPGAAFECGQPGRAWAVADALSAAGQPARAATLLEPLVTGCDAVMRLSTLERARNAVPRADYLRWEAREAGMPKDPRSEQRYHRIVYDRILADRGADTGPALERATRLTRDLGESIVGFGDTGVAVGLGWLWLEAGDAANARLWFGRAYAWSPDWEDAITGLAHAAMRERDYASVLVFTDKLAPDVPGRAALRRDARVAIAQNDFAFERYAEAADGLEKAAKEGELPRYARAMQAWCDLRLGNRERSAARFAALYRGSPDRESAEGLIAASGGAGAIPADLAAKEPLRALVAVRQGEDAFRNGRLLEARALDPKRWGEAGSPGVLQALLGGGFRKKTGEPGLGKMRQSLWPAVEVASGLSPWTAIAIRGDRAELDAGTLSSTALVGSAPTGAGPTPQLQTKATVNEGRVAVRYERGFALTAALGRGPGGGPVGARTVGSAELAVTPAWGQSTLAVFAEPVRETVLSYAGMRDPWTGTPWGGVMRRGVEARFLRLRDAPWTTGLRVRGEDITGTLVQDNTRAVVDATLGRDLGFAGFAYAAASAYAGLEGHRRNLGQMTIGHGGYFSPQRYARVGAALDFMTEEDRRWLVRGRLSGGYFDKRDDETPVLPLSPDGRFYPGGTNRGHEAAFRLAAVARATPYLQVGAMVGRSLSPSYAENIARLELRVLFEPRRSVVGADLPAARGE